MLNATSIQKILNWNFSDIPCLYFISSLVHHKINSIGLYILKIFLRLETMNSKIGRELSYNFKRCFTFSTHYLTEKFILSWIFFIHNVISYSGFKGISVTQEGSPYNQIVLPVNTFPICIKLCWVQFHVILWF